MAWDPDDDEIEKAYANGDLDFLKSLLDWYRDPEAGGKAIVLKELQYRNSAIEEGVAEALRWRSWHDDPPEPYTDCLVMEGGGQVYRSNLPQSEDNEFLEWWRPFGPEPEGFT